jgi:hypothetical protein
LGLKREKVTSRRKARSVLLAGILVVGLLPFVTEDAAATSHWDCVVNDSSWQMTVGRSDMDGFVVKDVKYGTTPQYRVKYMNIKWVDIDVDHAGIVDLAASHGEATACYPYTGAGHVREVYTPDSSHDEGYTGVVITIDIDYTTAGALTLTLTSSQGGDKRVHELGIDVDCSENSSSDPSDDGLRFNHTYTTGPAAQVRYESAMFGDEDGASPSSNRADYEVVEPGLGNRLCLKEEAHEPQGGDDQTTGYALKCTVCTAEGSSTQYTNGPWDYLNRESTWNVDVMLAVTKVKLHAGSTNYVTKFEMTAYLL